jgi:hypothetical protein
LPLQSITCKATLKIIYSDREGSRGLPGLDPYTK